VAYPITNSLDVVVGGGESDRNSIPIPNAGANTDVDMNMMASYPTFNEDGVEKDLAYPESDDLAYPDINDYDSSSGGSGGGDGNTVVPPPLFDSQDQQNQPKKKSNIGDKAVVRVVPSHLQVRRRQRPCDTATTAVVRRNGMKRRRLVANSASGGDGNKIISRGDLVVIATLNEGKGKVMVDTTSSNTGGSGGLPKASNAVADDYGAK